MALFSAALQLFDEQVRGAVSGTLSDGYPYFEAPDGRVFFGRLDRSGHLPRISTDTADTYTIYWGDEALEREAES
jgi:hypothetical protein